MGKTVKVLIEHLRRRQDELGVNAFHFHHVFINNKIDVSSYPPEAGAIIGEKAGGRPPAEKMPENEITVDDGPGEIPIDLLLIIYGINSDCRWRVCQ